MIPETAISTTPADLSGLLDVIRRDATYQEQRDQIAVRDGGFLPGHTLGLIQPARPYLLSALATDTGAPLLVVASRIDQANNLAGQIGAWSPDLDILVFPEPAPTFYERAPWGQSVIQSRLKALATLVDDSLPPPLIVTTPRGLMQRTLPAALFASQSMLIATGSDIPASDPEALVKGWLAIGYEPVTVVTTPGMCSRKGGIVEIFPVAGDWPVRIELWGNEVESIRIFDPASQRTVDTTSTVRITPAREALPRFGPQVAAEFSGWLTPMMDGGGHSLEELMGDLHALGQGDVFPLLEFYLPWMYPSHHTLLDYLPAETVVVVDNWEALREGVAEIESQAIAQRDIRLEEASSLESLPLPFATWDVIAERLSEFSTVQLAGDPKTSPFKSLFAAGTHYGGQVKRLFEDLRRQPADRVVIVSRQAERLAEIWQERHGGPSTESVDALPQAPGPGTPAFIHGSLAAGWSLHTGEGDTHLLTDTEVFGWRRPETQRKRVRRSLAPEAHFADLKPGDYVVHMDYGIGLLQGLEKRTLQNIDREYLLVSYAGGDSLFVPLHQADRLSRYVGPDDVSPQLSRLGTPEWARIKARTREAVEEIAQELLDLYAARETITGHAFGADTPWQKELEASFPYFETGDQLRALAEVKADMESPRPMDRLLCGDVGYGKTEVALRAAFKAVLDGRQVAMLVPTTILAQQHYATFTQRMAPFPVEIEMLSRFRSPAEQAAIVEKLANGQVDIVIGTHRLLSRDVQFKDLGLLIIDEEQRFGVTHKEHFKQLRTQVDVLTLTATPIPRTLYLSLTGVRDISTIQTAPEERLPIVTHVGTRDDDLIRRAIQQETARGGQVFFVHNRVQSIYREAQRLSELVPEARLAVGHGQMPESELAEVMSEFATGNFDVLVCTSIIEAGLDIPTANTLIVDRADRFGLSQLYQLRGRVGRSGTQAYAYFFHPSYRKLTPEASARMETIDEQTELGAGMSVAMRDLEIRGAGDFLGVRQHGHISAVGFQLYSEMLAQAVRKSRRQAGRAAPGEQPDSPLQSPNRSIPIDLPLSTYIPTDYVPEVELRIQLYRRMAEVQGSDSIDEMAAELVDRFGPLPPPVENLLYQLRVKQRALQTNIETITTENKQISLRLDGLSGDKRQALQTYLGRSVRVSRRAIWLPDKGAEWQASLLTLLDKLASFPLS
jgi:transcription-repair coupling factor (superfamily II helicase)